MKVKNEEVFKMRKHSQIRVTADTLNSQLHGNFTDYFKVKEGKVKELGNMEYEDARTLLSDLMYDAEALISVCEDEEGVQFPKYLYSFRTYENNGKLDEVEITLKSKSKDTFKYKRTGTIKVDENFVENFQRFHIEAIFALYYRYQANANLGEVNEFIKEQCVANKIGYTFEFVLGDGKEYVTYIDNDKVVFNADLNCALEVAKKGLFQSGDEYLDVVRQEQIEKLVEVLSTTQTTAQLIKADVDIINFLIGYTTRKRADKLIRGTYHRRALHLNGVNVGYGYFEKDLEDGTSIFALLEKHKDGEITVALDPFNIKTLEVVDYDVLKEVEEVLA